MGEDVTEESSRGRVAGAGIAEPVHKPHIAVVNDDTTFLRLMHELLGAEEGYRVSSSFVGSEAYQFVRDVQPDLVVLDLVFGGDATEGWRTLDLLTLDPATRRIPVIVCSAATMQLQSYADWLSRFDVQVLIKPFDLDTLLEMISANLGAPRTGATRSDT
jgi:CheY-like chemotaxis protein